MQNSCWTPAPAALQKARKGQNKARLRFGQHALTRTAPERAK